jgi:hypothetical protein
MEISTATHLPFVPRGFGNFPRLDQAFAARHEIFFSDVHLPVLQVDIGLEERHDFVRARP